MRNLLFSLAIVFSWSHLALAVQDITCNQGDCLTYGWQITDMKSGSFSETSCTNMNCASAGWVSSSKGSNRTNTVCKPDGCFVAGWRVYDSQTGQQLSDTTCYRGFAGQADCLNFGWDTVDYRIGTYTTRCILGDCWLRGWDTRAPGYPLQRTTCKQNGCFQDGWTVRP